MEKLLYSENFSFLFKLLKTIFNRCDVHISFMDMLHCINYSLVLLEMFLFSSFYLHWSSLKFSVCQYLRSFPWKRVLEVGINYQVKVYEHIKVLNMNFQIAFQKSCTRASPSHPTLTQKCNYYFQIGDLVHEK